MQLSWGGLGVAGVEVQIELEQGVRSNTDWNGYLAGQIQRFSDAHVPGNAGHLRMFVLRSICCFTCFIIDDDVFFFPMLARNDSSQDPTIMVRADSVLGRSVIQHFESLFGYDSYCEPVYDSRSVVNRGP